MWRTYPTYPALWLVALLAASACTLVTTKVQHVGVLPGGQPLVTLVVSEAKRVVRRECVGETGPGAVLGCHISRSITLGPDRQVHAIKIVRYTDFLPSEMALEIDAHELCHAVAALQDIEDPCHTGNGGILQSTIPTVPNTPRLVIRPY